MKLILYNNLSESNKVDKIITKLIELEGSLLEVTSLVNPSVKIFFNPEDFNGYVVENNQVYIVFNGLKITWDSFIYNYVLSANYAYIPLFNRYYVINDIISIRNNIWRLNMSVDVLMSYKKEIRNLYAFVNRNEFDYNKYIRDDLVSFYYDKNVVEYIPAKGNKVNKTFSTEQDGIHNNIAITVINEDLQHNFNSLTSPASGLPDITGSSTGESFTSSTYVTFVNSITALTKRLQANNESEYAKFILSIIVFPFIIESASGDDFALKLGNHVFSSSPQVLVQNRDKNLSKYYVIADFTITADSFLDYEPFTNYEIYLPYLGWIPLSADNILNKRLIVYYVVDYTTGNAQVTIYDCTDEKIIYTGNTQLGVKLGITYTNQQEVNNNRNSNNIGLGVGLLTSAVSVVAGVATYNPIAVAGGVISAGSTIAKFVQNNNTNYLRASGSVNSGQSGLYLPQEVKVRKTVMKPKNYNADYAKLFGKPLNEYRKLDGLSGYTTLGQVHLENIGSATNVEIDELDTLLKSGIIL